MALAQTINNAGTGVENLMLKTDYRLTTLLVTNGIWGPSPFTGDHQFQHALPSDVIVISFLSLNSVQCVQKVA